MAAPVFVQASNGFTDAGGDWSVQGNTPTVGNILILQMVQDGNAGTITMTSTNNRVEALDGTADSMTYMGSRNMGSPTAAVQHLWIGRVSQALLPNVSGTNTGTDDLYSRFYEFSGVNTGTALSDVIENSSAGSFSNGSGTSAAISGVAVVTLDVDRLALNFVGVDDDNAVGPFTGNSGGTWAEAAAEYATATGTDACLQLQTSTLASAGTITGGSYTMAASDNWGVIGFALKPPAGGTSKTLIPVTVNHSAQPLSFTKAALTKNIVAATETNAAQALSSTVQGAIQKTLNAVIETNAAQLLTFSQTGGDIFVNILPAADLSVATALSFSKAALSTSIIPAVETNTAVALAFTKAAINKTLGPAAEADASQPLTFSQAAIAKTLGIVSETDTVFPKSYTKAPINKFLGIVGETDTATPLGSIIGPSISKTLGAVGETNVAVPVSATLAAIQMAINAAVETDTPQVLSFFIDDASIRVTLVPVTEVDTVQPLNITQAAIEKSLVPVGETDVVPSLSSTLGTPISVSIIPATESDAAQPVAYSQAAIVVTIDPATELDTAHTLSYFVEGAVSQLQRARVFIFGKTGYY